ncbi:hypothetical protein LTR85_002101 [Meristemomyces frigidus]|nr:hypothetical protein LTR85_002101 [Meristemomyces frigidus]
MASPAPGRARDEYEEPYTEVREAPHSTSLQSNALHDTAPHAATVVDALDEKPVQILSPGEGEDGDDDDDYDDQLEQSSDEDD